MENSKKYSFALVICVGFVAGLFIKLFVLDILHVSGRSMEPSVRDGAVLFVNKLAFGIVEPYGDKLLVKWGNPERDDIVIYLYDNKIVVKRCVAVAGDKIEYSTDPIYTLTVADKTIPLSESQFNNMKASHVVPDDYILAIGDNYAESIDSRTYGFVSEKNILGKVICK